MHRGEAGAFSRSRVWLIASSPTVSPNVGLATVHAAPTALRGCPGHNDHSSNALQRPSEARRMIHRSRYPPWRGILVADLDPSDGDIALQGDDLGGQREALVWSPALCFPHLGDCGKPHDLRLERRQPVGGILGEELVEGFGPGGPPRAFVSGDPSFRLGAVRYPLKAGRTSEGHRLVACVLGMGVALTASGDRNAAAEVMTLAAVRRAVHLSSQSVSHDPHRAGSLSARVKQRCRSLVPRGFAGSDLAKLR
jgi:hypothetical protein